MSLILGMIALSLMFLAGYGGMVSAVADERSPASPATRSRCSAPTVRSASGFGWPLWVAVPIALVIARHRLDR